MYVVEIKPITFDLASSQWPSTNKHGSIKDARVKYCNFHFFSRKLEWSFPATIKIKLGYSLSKN